MELKRNDATANRPEGDRVIDGTYVFIDIPGFIDQLTKEKAWEKNDRNAITVFKAENMTMVISALQKGAELADNSVDGFITIQVIKGRVRIKTPDGDIDAEEKQIITFHPAVNHSVIALSDAYILLTNYTKNL